MSLFEVRVGERVWLDGQPWLVEELSGASALIRHGSTFHRVALERLRSAVPLGGDATERPLEDTESWSAAGKADQSKALHRARVVEEILRSESRAAVTAAADAEGVSVRTIQRWITAYRDAAAPGLLDLVVLRADRGPNIHGARLCWRASAGTL
ncbi:helix-turn-helix domain-containing protein [Kytococcus sedentarius]|uniref:helix-turn-helix domain-containing protein n=1 Tax=Kytococcus sedentarius TaxID=1276 RepID=UPI0009D69723|nr:helix-turn-helix domain-containing protein [Kytococcus sedentarius]